MLSVCTFVCSGELAHLKVISQSGVFSNNTASLAVDGNISSCCIACTLCGIYEPRNTSAWVQIDLGDDYTIVNMTLIGSTDAYSR